MHLHGQKIKADINGENLELIIVDKFREYVNQSNQDVYLCKDKEGWVYRIYPENISRFIY